jgi:hypothetical protein
MMGLDAGLRRHDVNSLRLRCGISIIAEKDIIDELISLRLIFVAKEKQDKDFAAVNTKIVTKKGEAICHRLQLHQTNGSWKIYDAVIENVSLVNNSVPNSTASSVSPQENHKTTGSRIKCCVIV